MTLIIIMNLIYDQNIFPFVLKDKIVLLSISVVEVLLSLGKIALGKHL